jgi:ABC-type uncharacterized transport system permease subunit
MSICTNIGGSVTVQDLFFCGVEGLFSFDFILVAIAIIGLIAVMCYKFKIPPLFSLFTGLTVLYSISLVAGESTPLTSSILNSFLVLSFLGIGAYVAFSLLDYYKNYTR